MTAEAKGKLVIIGSYLVALVMDTERIPAKGETTIGKEFPHRVWRQRLRHGGTSSPIGCRCPFRRLNWQ